MQEGEIPSKVTTQTTPENIPGFAPKSPSRPFVKNDLLNTNSDFFSRRELIVDPSKTSEEYRNKIESLTASHRFFMDQLESDKKQQRQQKIFSHK